MIIWQMKHDEAHNTLTSCLFVNENKNCVTDVLSSKDFRMKHPIDLQAIEIDSEVLLGRLSLHSAFLSHGVCVCVCFMHKYGCSMSPAPTLMTYLSAAGQVLELYSKMMKTSSALVGPRLSSVEYRNC